MTDTQELKKEKLYRLEKEKYRYFIPTVKGEEFINLVGSNEWFITLYSAANGIGKTATAVNMLAHLFFPCGNKYFQTPLWLDWPYIKRGRIVSDPTNIQEKIIPELKKWLPEGRYTTEKKGKNYEYFWKMDTGFSFDLMTYDQETKEFESVDLGWCFLDEPCPEAIYKANISRLRMGGRMFITETPIGSNSIFLYDEIICNTNNEKGKRAYVQADVWSACKDIPGTRGQLSRQNIELMISQYSEEDKQARIFGKYQHLTGIIFKQFSRKIHVIKPFDITMENYVVWEMLDPHPRHPDAVLWVAIDRKGTIFVVDELSINVFGKFDELAQRIKNKASQFRIVKRLADPAAFNEDQHRGDSNNSLAKILSEKGLHYQKATKFRSTADRCIANALNFQELGGFMQKPPQLYFFDNCKQMIWEVERYRWDNWVGKARNKKGAKEKPVDKDDHFIENLGRCLIQKPQFREMEKENDFSDSDIPLSDPY